jgi:hypothetical protein
MDSQISNLPLGFCAGFRSGEADFWVGYYTLSIAPSAAGDSPSVVVIVYPWLKPWVKNESSATADLEVNDGNYWFYLPSIVLPIL